jgi:hypothetical protein
MSDCNKCKKLQTQLETRDTELEELRDKYHAVELLFWGWAPDGEGLLWKIRNRLLLVEQRREQLPSLRSYGLMLWNLLTHSLSKEL